MSIWLQQPELTALNALSKNTLVELLDIRFEAFDDDSLTASMVVDPRTQKPLGPPPVICASTARSSIA